MNYTGLKKLLCLAAAGGTLLFGGGSEAAVVTDKAPILTYADHTVPTYNKPGGKQIGFITANMSLVKVKSVRSDGWAYGSYSIAGGKRVDRWFEMGELQGYAGFQNYTLTIDADRVVYRTSAAASRLGSVRVNATATVLGEEGNYLKIIYRVNGGNEWRMGWIEREVAPSHDNNYENPDDKPADDNPPGESGNNGSSGNTYNYINIYNKDDHSIHDSHDKTTNETNITNNTETNITDDHSVHDSHDKTSTEINITNNNGQPETDSGDEGNEEYVVDGNAAVDYPADGDYHKVKISGWTDGTQVRVAIGGISDTINIDNPSYERRNFEKEYALPASMEGTTQTVRVDALDGTDPSNIKRIAEKNISIPKARVCGQLKGDVNGDGKVDESDVKLLEQYNVGLIDVLPCPKNADMNDDGRHTLTDIAQLQMLLDEKGDKKKPTQVYSPEFSEVSLSVHDYDWLRLTGKVFDRDDMNQNLAVRVDVGGGAALIQANKGDHRFDEDLRIIISEGASATYRVTLTAVNVGGGSDTSLDKGTVRIESPIVAASGIRLATGTDGIVAGAIVELQKEDRAANKYFVRYNNGPSHWELGGHEGWVSKGAVDSYECWWARTVTRDGYAYVYMDPNTSSGAKTSKGNWERIKWPQREIGILITGQSNGFYRVRYHSYTEEDNVVKDRWVLASDVAPI